MLYQITGAGDVQGTPQSNMGQWFVAFATTSDLTGAGVCGYQIYIVDFTIGKWGAVTQLGQLPPDALGQSPRSTIGLRTFEFKESTPTTPASAITVFTTDGSALGAMVDDDDASASTSARLTSSPGRADQRLEGPRAVPADVRAGHRHPSASKRATTRQGSIDCNGGDTGADRCRSRRTTTSTTPTSSATRAAARTCRASACSRERTRASARAATKATGMCNAGAASGAGVRPRQQLPELRHLQRRLLSHHRRGAGGGPCVDPDILRQVGLSCTNDKESTCNGRPLSAAVGNYVAGGARVSIPVKISVSLDPGPDDVFCSGDAGELYSNLKNLDAVLRLTTGTTSAMISDANNTPLATITGTTAGSPFSCAAPARAISRASRWSVT